MKRLINWFTILIKRRKELKRWQRIVTVLAAMITFATTYALILPAITVERDRTEEVAGMYLEQEENRNDLLEENALEFTGVSIAADQENAVTYEYSDDGMTAVATFSTDEKIPEGAELVVNPVDTESEEYADLSRRASLLLDREFIYDVTTCSFYDFALICDGVDVTPKTGLVDVQISYLNNTVEHVEDVVFAGRFGRSIDKSSGFVTMSADDMDEVGAAVEAVDTQGADDDLAGSGNQVDVNDELISANPDESPVIELTDSIITTLSLKGNDLSQTDSVVGILAGHVDEEAKAAAVETDAEVPSVDDIQEDTSAPEVKTLKAAGKDYTVTLTYDETSEIPEGASLSVSEIAQDTKEYKTYLEKTKKAMGLTEEENLPRFAARFFDIKIMVGDNEFKPESGVSVEITYAEPLAENPETEVSAVHFADKKAKAEVIKANTSEVQDDGAATVEFTAESFSVYGVIYTVDFYWEVNGKLYEFSLPGGGFVSLQQLVEVLGIAKTPDINKKSDGLQATDDTEETESNNSADNNIGTENGEEISSIDDGTVENKPLTLNDVVVSDETRKFVADVETVKFSAPNLVWVGKAVEASTVSGLKEANELEVQYSMELTEDQIKKINDTEVESGDWALISMLPFESEESLTVSMKTGEVFTIRVTDAVSDAVKRSDGTVNTIPNPSGTTIDLFDYWIKDDLKDKTAREAWPDTLGQVSTGNNLGINHNHMLKFTPANTGSVTDGTLGNGNQAAVDGGQGLNSWTTNASPRPGIVENKLYGGYPKLTDGGRNTFPVITNRGKNNQHTYINALLGTNGESLAYLFDNTPHDGKQTYFGVNHLLYVDPDGFYTYESNDFKANYNSGSKTFTLTDQTDPVGDARGFWPFGKQKYWVGMHVNAQFSMPADGRVLGPKGKYNDMQFEFKGDDDTWVYVDGVLVGDGGGIHNQTKIEINFRNGTARVTGKEDPKDDYYSDYDHTLYLDDLYRAAGRYNDFEWEPSPANNDHETFKAGTYHTFDMFYLERGGGESNLYIHYNLISTADFTAHKSYHSEGNHRLLRDQFQFELIGLDGQYRGEQGSRELIDPEKQAIMPKGGSSTGTGLVGDPYKNHSNGQTIYKVGVSEDGNINFGDADISSEEMRNCDNGSPSTYRYMVREIVPPDAVNADAKTWAQATEEERAEGGFHKVDENGEDITYDGKVYYFEGTVRRNLLSDGSYKYDLKKTRYTDATFTTEDTETKFFSFVNGHIDPLTLKVNKKSHTNKSLVGAEFKLTRAKKSDGKWMVREGSSTQTVRSNNQGEVIFNNPALTEGHYLLEETSAPAGYLQSDNLWLVTVNKLDSDTKIVLSPTITLLSSDGTPIGDPEPITVDNTTFTFEKTIVNSPIPKGDITVVKKWVKPNGVEYTQEEMSSLNTTETRITGELWRKGQGLTTTQVKNPTVTIYGKRGEDNSSGNGTQLQNVRVVNGSDLTFRVYRDYTNHSAVSATTNNGSRVENLGVDNNYYCRFKLSDITQDTVVYVRMPIEQSHPGNANENNIIRSEILSSEQTTQEYTTQQGTGEIDEKVEGKDFVLTGNTWSVTWTRDELGENPDDSFTYYLKNVVEQNPNGFTFLKDETGTLDPATGTITFIQKNTNEKTQVKVKKEWVPEPETPSEASVQMILHRYRMLTKGVLEVTLVSDQGAAIQGAEFDLYKDNEIIGTYSTDVSGKIIVPDLTEGSYYLQQRTTPEPYRMEGTVKTEVWPVSGDSFDQQEHKETLVNYTKEPAGLFTILLTDPEGNGLENGIFDLYEQGQADPILTGITTDENGRWTTDRLGQGTYYFVQTGAPEGYVLPDQTQTNSFSVNDPNQVLEKTVTIVNNHKAKGRVTVTLTKDDENGQPIAGAEFELYFNGILLKSGITDENGIVSFTDLGAGSYQVKQRSSASGMNIAPFNEELHSFTIVEDGTTNQDKTMSFVNTASSGNVKLNIFSARSGSQYNAYPVDTFTGLKANTTYRVRIGVPASNVESGDQVSICRLYEPGKVPQGEEPIDNSLWQYGSPEYVLYNGSNVRMKYYSIEFKPESDDTEYNYSIDSMQGWGLYPVTADTPVAVRQAASPLSSGRNLLRKNSIPASGAKGNSSKSNNGAANDAQPIIPSGYKNDNSFSMEYTITSSDSNWEHIFENLDKYDANGNPYIYYVVEGERTPQEYWVSSYEPNADGSVITVKNISTIELTIKKIDQTDMETVKNNQSLGGVSLLEGAKFKLLKYSSITPNKIKDTNWNQQHSNETSGTDGTFTFSDIGPGIYEIVETAYPDGYIRPIQIPFIQVAPNLTVQLLSEDGTVLSTADSYYILDDTTIVVGNPQGAALPSTGGPGTRLFTFLGSILILGAGVLLWRRRRLI